MNWTVNQIMEYIQKNGKAPYYSPMKPILPYRKDRSLFTLEMRLWRFQALFLEEFCRIELNLPIRPLPKLLEEIQNEDERDITVRFDFEENPYYHFPEIWTRFGRLTKMAILKPKEIEDFNNLKKWKLVMLYPEHQKEVIEFDVADAIGQFDHIMAWYALWRKWPIQYPVWEWAIEVWKQFATLKDFTDYGFQDYYHSWWLWAEIKINFVRYDKSTAVKMDDVKYQCPWER